MWIIHLPTLIDEGLLILRILSAMWLEGGEVMPESAINRDEDAIYSNRRNCIAGENLTLQTLIDTMEKLGPPLPRLEFQVGESQTWAFGQALARASGMPVEHRLRQSYSYSAFGSIPIVEYETDSFPPGFGLMVELVSGSPTPKRLFILDWASGKLIAVRAER